MTTQEQYIERLREMVEQKFGRKITTPEDCDALAEAVGEVTNTKLDTRAYVTLFLADKYSTLRPITLSTLTRYIGYESWSAFCASDSVRPAADSDMIPVTRRWGVVILTIVAILIVVGAALFLLVDNSKSETSTDDAIATIEHRWIMRTIEECNAIRAYEGNDDYYDQLALFIETYSTELSDNITSEIMSHDIDDVVARREAERITSMCISICEVLYTE